MLSIPHMIVVFIVVLVVFGPQKLPELARGLGKLMAEFRKASLDFRNAFEEEMRDLERQALLAERKKAAEAVAAQPSPAVLPASQPTTEASASEGASSPAPGEVPVVSPVAEAVPRSSEESPESKGEEVNSATAGIQESQQDSQHSV